MVLLGCYCFLSPIKWRTIIIIIIINFKKSCKEALQGRHCGEGKKISQSLKIIRQEPLSSQQRKQQTLCTFIHTNVHKTLFFRVALQNISHILIILLQCSQITNNNNYSILQFTLSKLNKMLNCQIAKRKSCKYKLALILSGKVYQNLAEA